MGRRRVKSNNPQLVARLRKRLSDDPAVLHSALSDIERLAAWRAALGAAHLVVGTRSAIFTPMRDPALITTKNTTTRSSSRKDCVIWRATSPSCGAKHLDVPVLLGSHADVSNDGHCRTGATNVRLIADGRHCEPPAMRLIDTVRTPATDGISEPLDESDRSVTWMPAGRC